MNDPAKLFLKIVETVSKGRVRLKPTSKVKELFRELPIFCPLEYELALYSLEASVQREIDDSFYEGGVEKDFEMPISDFIAKYLHEEVSSDPLFVTRQFMKFATSAGWEADEKTEPGPN